MGYLTTTFSAGMDLRGSLSGGTRLTKIDIDGTRWVREEAFSYDFETKPEQYDGRRNQGSHRPQGHNGGRPFAIENGSQAVLSWPSRFEEI